MSASPRGPAIAASLFVATIVVFEVFPVIGRAVAFLAGWFGLVVYMVGAVFAAIWLILAWSAGARAFAAAGLALLAVTAAVLEYPGSFKHGVERIRQSGG